MLKQTDQTRPFTTSIVPRSRHPARPPIHKARLVGVLGPALVAGVAYLDPGNVASNTTAGARFGYLLVWVVVTGNIMAWLVQYLSAKLGVVTGRSLAELLGERIGHRWTRRAYWIQAELVAVATDVAEVIGGAVALALLFDLPLIVGGVITGTRFHAGPADPRRWPPADLRARHRVIAVDHRRGLQHRRGARPTADRASARRI